MDIAQIVSVLCLVPLAALIFKIPELGLVLCLVVGVLVKGIIQPFLGPIDITAYLFAITYGSIFIRCSMEKKLALPDLRVSIGVLLLVALLLASLLYTPPLRQGTDVFLRFVFLTISMMYATFVWCTNINRIKRLLFIFGGLVLACGTAAVTWVFLLQHGAHPDSGAAFPGTGRLGVAQLLAAGIITTFILRGFVTGKYRKLTLDLLMIAGTIELIALNSRGPLIAFLVGIFFLFLLYTTKERKRVVFLAPIIVAVIILPFILLPSGYTSRYALITNLESSSIAARLDMWRFVAQHFSDWFFTGAGIFGFAYHYYPGQTEFSIWGAYPHNIFLDVFAAAGFFGLLAFVWLIGSLVYKGIKVSKTRERSFHLLGLATAVPFITFLAAGLFSMSIIGTRPLWFLGGVVLSLERLWRKENKESIVYVEG